MATCGTTAAAPIAIAHTAHIASPFPPPPTSAPPSPPPPPSPASPASPSLLSTPFHPPTRPTHLLRRATTLRPGRAQGHAVFDLESSSPLSPSGAEKTLLLARLERARNTHVLLRSGQPARQLTERELRRLQREEAGESSTASGTACEGGGTGTEDGEDIDASTPPSVEALAAAMKNSASLAPIPVQPMEPPAQVAAASSLPAASPRLTAQPISLAIRTTITAARTAPPTPSRSPITAHFPSLLSRAPTSSTHVDPAQAQATAPASRSTGAGGHQLALKLAEAVAAQQAHAHQHAQRQGRPARARKSASPSSPATPTAPTLPAAARKQALGKTRSLPPAPSAPPTPGLGPSAQHARAATFPAHSLPAPAPVFPPFRTGAHARSRTASSRLSPSPVAASPSTSPLLLPVMGAADPSALTLHFARKPDMPRKGSLGESWSRMCLRGERDRTAKGVFGSWSGGAGIAAVGMVRAASGSETEETEESGAEGDAEDEREVLRDASEASVFASPRSSFASSFLSSTLSRSRSVSSTHTPTPSSSVSPSESPKLQPIKLGGSAGPHAPLGRWEDVVAASEPPPPPAVPAHKASSDPNKPGALLIAPPGAAAPSAPTQLRAGVEMKRLRAEQMARRREALAKEGGGDAWESSSSGADEPSPREAPAGGKKEDRGRMRGTARVKGVALRRG
ncbi:hypothetical protein JCM10450v2_006552 [Rhodotorula kratochvilovae]